MPKSTNKRNVEECHEAVDGETTNSKTCSKEAEETTGETTGETEKEKEKEKESESSCVLTKEATEPAKKKPRRNESKAEKGEKESESEVKSESTSESKSGSKTKSKSVPQISKNRFVNEAQEFEFTIDGHGHADGHAHKHVMKPKLFTTGSVGWHYAGRIKMTVDGKPLSTQCNVLATVMKSKQWPQACGGDPKDTKDKDKEHNDDEEEEENHNDGDYDPDKEEEYQKEKEKVVEEGEVDGKEKEKEKEDDEEEEGEDGDSEASGEEEIIKMKKSDFLSKAQNITIGGFEKAISLKPKKFKTNSVGWYSCSRPHKLFDGVNLLLQVGVTFTVLGSKTWEE